ncbi:thioredoxin [Paenibacillus sp. GCM10027626]|uniref:thioredoxin n=1 Tax=Paenibacillus sp. GCM10027626 TaxID=3273411 RepID=UPI003626AE20
MAIYNTTDAAFAAEIKQEGITLVNFWAPWCGPCRAFAPILEEFDQQHNVAVKIVKVNVDENPETASKFRIMSIPTTILFKNGEPVQKLNGIVSLDSLQQVLAGLAP